MAKITGTVALAIGWRCSLPRGTRKKNWRQACIQQCYAQPAPGDPEMQRQEIVSLEKEAAHAIQLKMALTFSAYTATILPARFARSAGKQDAVDRSDRISCGQVRIVPRLRH